MKTRYIVCIVFILAFVFRLILIPIARHGDINNNVSWGQLLLANGPINFYDQVPLGGWPYSAPNQPPLYLYLFTVTSFFQQSITHIISFLNSHVSAFPSSLVWTWDEWGELFLAKMPPVLADLGIALIIYQFFKRQERKALLLSAVWLASPISWYNSAIWGGTDSIVNVLGLLSIYYLLQKKNLIAATFFFTLSLLFKGSLAIFIPVFLFLLLKQKYRFAELIKAVSASVITVIIASFPFHMHVDLPLWLIQLYVGRFLPGEIGSLTANAFNFWWLIDSGKTLDSTLYLGFSARMWGYLIVGLGYGAILYSLYKKYTQPRIFISLCLIPVLYFLFFTRIHERYMYPFFPLAVIGLGYWNLLWIPYLILNITSLLNLYHLFWAPGIPLVESWYLNPLFAITLSVINIVVFFSMAAFAQKSGYNK